MHKSHREFEVLTKAQGVKKEEGKIWRFFESWGGGGRGERERGGQGRGGRERGGRGKGRGGV